MRGKTSCDQINISCLFALKIGLLTKKQIFERVLFSVPVFSLCILLCICKKGAVPISNHVFQYLLCLNILLCKKRQILRRNCGDKDRRNRCLSRREPPQTTFALQIQDVHFLLLVLLLIDQNLIVPGRRT